jgi:hypothetical protein
MINTDLKPEKPQPKVISVDPQDLVLMCTCRKVTMHIKGGKADLRRMDSLVSTLRESCTAACGCGVMLVNAARQPHD